MDEPIFPQISAATKSKEAWDVLQKVYQGNTKVNTFKLQTLRRKFETLYMKESEPMHDYFLSISEIVNQIELMVKGYLTKKVLKKLYKACQQNMTMLLLQLKSLWI